MPDDVAALAGLTQGLLRQRKYESAAEALRQLASVDPDPAARVGHLITLGEILAGPLRDAEGAADAWEKSLEIDPARGVTVDRLDVVLTELDDPRRLAKVLTRHLEAVPDDVARRLRLARLLRGPLGNAGSRGSRRCAWSWSRCRATRACGPSWRRSSRRRGVCLTPITEHLALLRAEPLRAASLRALRRLYGRTGNRARLENVIAVLTALGMAEADDEQGAREARRRWTEEPRGALGVSDFEELVRHPAERHPATALLLTLTEVIPRLHPINLEEWGVTRADRLGPRADDPLRAIVQRLTALFGIEEAFEVYMARSGITQVEVEATLPAALLVPASLLASVPRREAMLQIARAMARLRAGSYLATRLSARELGVDPGRLAAVALPRLRTGLGSEDSLVDMEQRVARLVPRRHRREFERAVVGVAEAGPARRQPLAPGHDPHRASRVPGRDR